MAGLTLRDIAVKLVRGELPAAASEDLAGARLTVCKACPEFQKLSRQCRLCGCFMDVKVKFAASQCPKGLW